MSSHIDDYEEYNYDADKLVNGGHSGKNRSKKEASEHTNHFDPSGHSRKLAAKLQNTESNRKEENLKPHPITKK
ncbi:nuclear protein 1 [Daktulosphaira vitifoliae]|uniref:nuclear protein 1 n=1 Tax=Daktulosphaira vitifoliae TaxID=58002 RepID=UPI0021A9ADCE|nr:nuclear protein 1 [Daktulosphaira vitifoliae]